MRKKHIAFIMFASLMAVSTAPAETLDWPMIQFIRPNTPISVVTQKRFHCNFEKTNDDKLFCLFVSRDLLPFGKSKVTEIVFNRAGIREVRLEPVDDSKGYLSLILAAGGGGGLDSAHQPTSFAGVKMGGPFSLDLQYDRIQSQNGFSTEGSAVIPLFRVPRFQPNKELKFLKAYVEPGVGYRVGGGAFGGYSSAKVLVVLLTNSWSDNWAAPNVEFQRRFPFESPLQGDDRLTFGVMLALCEHCGLN
jgi:hypothetical protein